MRFGKSLRGGRSTGDAIKLILDFLFLLIAGAILLALILVGVQGMPVPLQALRILLGILFVLLAPGYALQAALFPQRRELDPLARAAFSFGLSIVVIPLILLALNAVGIGVQFWPIASSLGALIAVCTAVAFLRRRRSPNSEEPNAAVPAGLKTWWASLDRFTRRAYAFLALAFSVAAVSGVIVSQEAPAEPFTEFYLLDSQGLSMDYPREVTAGTQVTCILGIKSHEGQPSQYRIVAVGGGDQALSSTGPISLADGESWQGDMTIVLERSGDGQEVEFLLERIGSPWPYRTLRIWMNVYPAGETATGTP